MPFTRAAHHATRSATAAADSASPVSSSVPPRTGTRAQAVRAAPPPATAGPRVTGRRRAGTAQTL
jgi:hypothetical protein